MAACDDVNTTPMTEAGETDDPGRRVQITRRLTISRLLPLAVRRFSAQKKSSTMSSAHSSRTLGDVAATAMWRRTSTVPEEPEEEAEIPFVPLIDSIAPDATGVDFDFDVHALIQTDDEAEQLGRRMAALPKLKRVDLCRAGMDDASMCALCGTLSAPDSLSRLRCLLLDFNGFGDLGLSALAAALAAGAMARLQQLGLAANEIADRGVCDLAATLWAPSADDSTARRPLSSLIRLSLQSNHVGDRGVTALAAAACDGAFPRLEYLMLNDNRCDHDGKSALAAAIDSGALPRLRHLNIYANGYAADESLRGSTHLSFETPRQVSARGSLKAGREEKKRSVATSQLRHAASRRSIFTFT